MTTEEIAKLCPCQIARQLHGTGMMCFRCTGPIGLEKAKARAARLLSQEPSR